MIETPEIAHTHHQLAAVLPLRIPRADIQKVMGPGIEEVMATLAAQGVAPAGPWFTHHLRMEPGTFDFEIGVPVATPVAPAGRVKPGHLPAARVARAVHRGGYEALGAAWEELDRWIMGKGHEPAADLWEVYRVGPESSPDPAAWRTELNRPLLG